MVRCGWLAAGALTVLGAGCTQSAPAVCRPAMVALASGGTSHEETGSSNTPSAVEHGTGSFTGVHGTCLFSQWWRPAQPARGVIVVMHGLKDHSGRYASWAENLVSHGYAVYAFDMRGHGRSGGDPVYVDAFREYVDDLDTFVQDVRRREPERPLFLFGHSMGGAIVTTYVIERHPVIEGFLLSAPALRPGRGVSDVTATATRVIGDLASHFAVFDLPDSDFSRDPEVVAAMRVDPLVHHGDGPARTAAELLRAMDRIQHGLETVDVPFFVMHGTVDRLTDPQGSRQLYERAHTPDRTLCVYDGYFHDLLREPGHPRIERSLLTWLDAHVSPGSAPVVLRGEPCVHAPTPAPSMTTTQPNAPTQGSSSSPSPQPESNASRSPSASSASSAPSARPASSHP